MNDSKSGINDPHFSYIRSINNDLVLLGNALMTRNNDINSIHDFVTASIDSLSNETLKSEMHDLNEQVIGCDNDEDRLRLLTVMQHTLAKEALTFLGDGYADRFKKLSLELDGVNAAKGDDLKAKVSHFQVDILSFVPCIEQDEHQKLSKRAVEVLESKGKSQLSKIDNLYEEINVLIQPSFDDLFD